MFKALTLVAAVVVAAVLAAAAAAAPPTHTSADRTFSTKAAQGDRFERDTATVALAKGQTPKVKAFARMLIRDHTRSTAMLKKAFGGSAARCSSRASRPRS
jgi:putative membrane protein